MKRIGKPEIAASQVLTQCASLIKNKELAARLLSVIDYVASAENEYSQHATIGQLCAIASSDNVLDIVLGKEMEGMYKGPFRRPSSPLRRVYDAIKLSAPNGICPLCCQRDASTLDHYLPVSKFPAFAVTPINLVPACSNCNHIKLSRVSHTAEDQTIHPYFDDFDGEQWLFSEIIESKPVSAFFYIQPPGNLTITQKKRLEVHFNTFKLASLYTTYAAVELTSRSTRLKRLFDSGGEKAVVGFLEEEELSERVVAKNSWQAALYQALLSSKWFCSGGFM